MYRIGEKIASEWAEARLPHHIRKLSEFMDEKDDDDDDDRSHSTHIGCPLLEPTAEAS